MPDAELVAVLRAVGCVYAEDEAAILLESADSPEILARMMARRAHGYPLEHIVGWAKFYGLKMAVAPGVFVPRLRSEFLVEQVVASIAGMPLGNGPLRILDLCCGCGAVGAAVAHEMAGQARAVELYAADIDPTALSCASENIAPFKGQVHCGDLFAALPRGLRGTFHIIAANAPYVPSGALELMPQEARVHEPEVALDGGIDGLEVHRRIAAEAQHWLRPDGVLLMESSAWQAPDSAGIMASHGFLTSVATNDDVGGTVVTGHVRQSG